MELELWRALLSVANGQVTIFDAMRAFVEVIPNDELIGILTEEREFYCIYTDGMHPIHTGAILR